MKIIYKLEENGKATNLRFVENDYKLEINEILYSENDDKLPNINSLNSPIYKVPYTELRQLEYPPLTEQFDMLYWDSVNGTTIWKDTIAAIKVKYPKE